MDALKNELRTTYVALNATFREYLESQGFDKAIIDHYVQCFSANVGTGKLHRGLATLYIGRQLAKTEVNEEQSNQLCVLAWLVEMLGAHYLILDDIMDESTTRRGEPCWYRQPHIGLMAINDACILKSAIFFFLKKFLRQHLAYIDIVELFVDLGLHTELGQLCDLAAAKEEDIGMFTEEKYWSIVKEKSSYSISGPIMLALAYWRLATPKNLEQTHTFAVALGEYFQVNDDYIDVYGDYEITGKHGTDIQDKKCSWLIIEALSRANEEQRKRLLQNYGKKEPSHVDIVKKVFEELDLPKAFREYEEKQRVKIEGIIAAMDESEGLKRDIFLMLFQGFRKGRQF
ncbi:polyprenyl synthetase domain-containing protein [Trichoderma breve]|uniref:Polyprenyl synthetase domain-containing protein n=1 Tax=Trichoderma breve TaxID=2034170 RepID=A0A9W9JPV5_9HYPO|nr:polyprenyl synthetase domain-containing protein [Trichoderma breve]KAJ4863564.1 polyprenyl synthetase domain-containing protein [Trichoderma breve]